MKQSLLLGFFVWLMRLDNTNIFNENTICTIQRTITSKWFQDPSTVTCFIQGKGEDRCEKQPPFRFC